MDRISDVAQAEALRPKDDVVTVRYRRGDGQLVETVLDRLPLNDVLAGLPVRQFHAYRGRRHYSGWYWSATMGGHVVYESRLELARILIADQDPNVVAIAAQPVLLEGFDGVRVRRHVPDLLLGMASGGALLVDVKAPFRLSDSAVVQQFAWIRRICNHHGLRFEVWSGADAAWLENIRFLAGYRRANLIDSTLVAPVVQTVARPVALGQVERALDAPGRRALVRPVILHLLWTGALTADLSVPLSLDTLVWSR